MFKYDLNAYVYYLKGNRAYNARIRNRSYSDELVADGKPLINIRYYVQGRWYDESALHSTFASLCDALAKDCFTEEK